jgi:hypothetical protein
MMNIQFGRVEGTITARSGRVLGVGRVRLYQHVSGELVPADETRIVRNPSRTVIGDGCLVGFAGTGTNGWAVVVLTDEEAP